VDLFSEVTKSQGKISLTSRCILLLGGAFVFLGTFYGYVEGSLVKSKSSSHFGILTDPSRISPEIVSEMTERFQHFLKKGDRNIHSMETDQIAQLAGVWVAGEVRYISDLRQHGRLEHFATAEEVWRSKMDDCDGRAVVAVATLRSLGVEGVGVVISHNHAEVGVICPENMNDNGGDISSRVGGGEAAGFSQRLGPAVDGWRSGLSLRQSVAGIPWGRLMCFFSGYWLLEFLINRMHGLTMTKKRHIILGCVVMCFFLLEIHAKHFYKKVREGDLRTYSLFVNQSA
jgi:hypothetical protein